MGSSVTTPSFMERASIRDCGETLAIGVRLDERRRLSGIIASLGIQAQQSKISSLPVVHPSRCEGSLFSEAIVGRLCAPIRVG